MGINWRRCDQGACSGISLASGNACLAHAGGTEQETALQQFHHDGRLDLRGVTVSEDVWAKVLDAAPRNAEGSPVFNVAHFREATFTVANFKGVAFPGEAADFSQVTFQGFANFKDAKFNENAYFGSTTFARGANFANALFENDAMFSETKFVGRPNFSKTTFAGSAYFRSVKSDGLVNFAESCFERGAYFTYAVLTDGANFSEAHFKGNTVFSSAAFGLANFREAKFDTGAEFVRAAFQDICDFKSVTIKNNAYFSGAVFGGRSIEIGPMTVTGKLDMDDVQCDHLVRIELEAAELSCRRARFQGGIWFLLTRADVFLDDADLSIPSLLAGRIILTDGQSDGTELPRLLSLQRANVAGLALANINLAACRFAGAHNLDKLRLEGGAAFGFSPARAGWERREVIAEESSWRAWRRRPGSWNVPSWPDDSENEPGRVSPATIAGLYRALRKGREDAKNEPGAADFYYGEMEMRRHSSEMADTKTGGSRGRVTRSVLFAYWLVSGYGLRAWRSIAALAAIVALFAIAYQLVGFALPPKPDSYLTSLLFTFRSTLSLTDDQVKLTAWGSLLQALLRLTGPALLALTLLALRGRVKR